jgi:hypothetical protein
MERLAVISRFCIMSTLVGSKVFKHSCCHDCFCHQRNHFQFDDEILEFIEAAVNEKISREEGSDASAITTL